jgi:hypothetical protein
MAHWWSHATYVNKQKQRDRRFEYVCMELHRILCKALRSTADIQITDRQIVDKISISYDPLSSRQG